MKLYDFKSGDDKLQPLGQIPVLINKTADKFISLCSVYRCIHTTTSELSSYNRDLVHSHNFTLLVGKLYTNCLNTVITQYSILTGKHIIILQHFISFNYKCITIM